MDYFLQQLLNGLSLGAIYALIAIGYTMVYGIMGMINFAHGEVYMISAFIAVMAFLLLGPVITYIPLAILLVLLIAMLFTGLYGWAIERVAYRPLRGSFRLAPLISAIGMSILLQNYVQLAQGARVKSLPPQLSGGISLGQFGGAALQISYIQLTIIITTLALMLALSWIIVKTDFGRSQRAVAQDQTMASLLGIRVDQVISATFVLGAGLAAVAGVMVTLYYGVIDFFIGFLAGIKAFTAAVLGGIGSVTGAVLGGLIIGLIESFWSAYGSIQYKDIATFAVLILVLLIRPTGLLGKPEVEKI
ncbi:MAG: branched-chain amino acid ABC transporter permease LivH [Dongiaceae bacterium]